MMMDWQETERELREKWNKFAAAKKKFFAASIAYHEAHARYGTQAAQAPQAITYQQWLDLVERIESEA